MRVAAEVGSGTAKVDGEFGELTRARNLDRLAVVAGSGAQGCGFDGGDWAGQLTRNGERDEAGEQELEGTERERDDEGAPGRITDRRDVDVGTGHRHGPPVGTEDRSPSALEQTPLVPRFDLGEVRRATLHECFHAGYLRGGHDVFAERGRMLRADRAVGPVDDLVDVFLAGIDVGVEES